MEKEIGIPRASIILALKELLRGRIIFQDDLGRWAVNPDAEAWIDWAAKEGGVSGLTGGVSGLTGGVSGLTPPHAPRTRARKQFFYARARNGVCTNSTSTSYKSKNVAASSDGREKSRKSKKIKAGKLQHPFEACRSVVDAYLKARGWENADVARDPGGWGRWMKIADKLLANFKGRVDLAVECIEDRSREWSRLGDWTLDRVEARAMDWLAKKQAEVSR